MRSVDELDEIMDAIMQKITVANRMGELDELLTKWGLTDFVESTSVYDTYKDGKIAVIGATEVKQEVLEGIIKSCGLDKKRFEFCLEYDKTKTYRYDKLRYNLNYRAVIFGPVPHSSVGKNNSGSVISEMKSNSGYPRVEVLNDGNQVKITKSNFRNVLNKLVSEDYI